jgi:hypothetical protein
MLHTMFELKIGISQKPNLHNRMQAKRSLRKIYENFTACKGRIYVLKFVLPLRTVKSVNRTSAGNAPLRHAQRPARLRLLRLSLFKVNKSNTA